MNCADHADEQGYSPRLPWPMVPRPLEMGVCMSWGSHLRPFAVHAALIASAIQGLAPDASSLASPAALGWLGAAMAPGGPDAPGGKMPGNDRPVPLDADQDATAAEVAILAEAMAGQVSHRRLTGGCGDWLASARSSRHGVDPGVRSGEPEPDPPVAETDLISCRCRLSC